MLRSPRSSYSLFLTVFASKGFSRSYIKDIKHSHKSGVSVFSLLIYFLQVINKKKKLLTVILQYANKFFVNLME